MSKRVTSTPRQHTKTKKAKRTGDYQKGRELARQPKSELKAFDLSNFASVFQPAGIFTLLNIPINGPEMYQRVGRKMYMKSLHVRGFCLNVATSLQDMGRIIIFYDSQPNAAVSNIAALLQDSNLAATTSVFSEINLNNRERFKIIRDHQIMLPAVTNTAGVLTNGPLTLDPIKSTMNIDMFIKLKGLETIFNGVNGGTIADITSGSLYMLTVSNATGWEFSGTTRLRYYD